MFRISQPKANAVLATHQYLKALGAKVSEETVEETLKNHPDFPSLLATSDALNEWKVENVAVQIKPEQLEEIPTPFLAYLQSEGGIFALVKSVDKGRIAWRHTSKGLQKESIEDFIKKWNGVVLMAETNEQSGEKDYAQNHQKEVLRNLRVPILLIGLTLLIISLLYQRFTSDWQYNALLITKLAGTIISSLLLWQSIDKNNPFIKALCQAPNQKGKSGEGCSSILNSKAAQVTSWLNWSEVGFFYFAGGFISLLTSPLTPDGGTLLLRLLSIPIVFYSFWSLYYQGFVAKQWCTLCLAIQGILLIEFGLSIFAFSKITTIQELEVAFNSPIGGWATDASGADGGVAVILSWLFLKPILQKSQQVEPLKNDLRRFKNNPELFLSLLQKQEEMPYVADYL